MLGKTACIACAVAVLGLTSLPARAELKLCNNTGSQTAVAVGYKTPEGWITEGWWSVSPTKCAQLVKGDLIARYYYVFVIDRDKGGTWAGNSAMCTTKKAFTIKGLGDCEKRGYDTKKFFEIDTGEETDWTVSLSGEKTTQGQ